MGVKYLGDPDYANRNLGQTFVRWKTKDGTDGVAMIVSISNRDIITAQVPFIRGRDITKTLEKRHSSEVDLRPIELGYSNNIKNNNFPVYVSRFPSRQWRQGLTSKSIYGRVGSDVYYSSLNNCMNIGSLNRNRRGENIDEFIWSMRDLFFPCYPVVQEAVELINSGHCEGVAISKNMCLLWDKNKRCIVLHYTLTAVGIIDTETLSIRFNDRAEEYKDLILEEYQRLMA